MFTIKRLLYPLLAHPRFSQVAKYFVYSALVLNGVWYGLVDVESWNAALPDDAPLLDILTQIATVIDTIAWLGLVFLFELETYAIPDRFWTGWLHRSIRLLRVFCYIAIGFAAYGYTVEALNNFESTEIEGIRTSCEFADQGVSIQLDGATWVEISSENCTGMPDDEAFFMLEGEIAVIPASVLDHIQFLGWFDILNAFIWIFVVWLIEFEIWTQTADRFGGPVLSTVRLVKTLMYLELIGNGIVWGWYGYAVWAWDAFLWIFGFWAIELNLAEWEMERTGELAVAG